jgi:hypothetical protein
LTSIALGVAGVIVDQMWTIPGTDATAGEIAGFVDAHRSALLVAVILTAAGVALWLLFGVGVWVWMRETASGGESRASYLASGQERFLLARGRSDHCDSLRTVRLDPVYQHRPAAGRKVGLLEQSSVVAVLAVQVF